MAPVLKTGDADKASEGSNPSPSAKLDCHVEFIAESIADQCFFSGDFLNSYKSALRAVS